MGTAATRLPTHAPPLPFLKLCGLHFANALHLSSASEFSNQNRMVCVFFGFLRLILYHPFHILHGYRTVSWEARY